MFLKTLLCVLPLFFVIFTGLSQKMSFTEHDGLITLYKKGDPCFSYQKETKSLEGKYPRANYIHPLYDLDGNIITEDFPNDHVHHRGVFWAWHQLYANGKKVGDPWFCEGIKWAVSKVETQSSNKTANLKAIVYWINENDTLLKETTLISFDAPNKHYHEMDFKTTLEPWKTEIQIGGSEDEKGYGGFSVRIKTIGELQFFSDRGLVSPLNTAVDAGNWIRMNGIDMKGTEVVLMTVPKEELLYHGWILRKNRSMQNIVYPGRKLLSITKEKPLVLNHKIIVSKKPLSVRRIHQIYRKFSAGL